MYCMLVVKVEKCVCLYVDLKRREQRGMQMEECMKRKMQKMR